MSGPIDEVLAYFDEWGTADSMLDAMRRRFTPETVWENVGLSKTIGINEAVGFTEAFFKQLDIARGAVVTDHIAAVGNAVLTERTDIFYNTAGETVFAVKLMGILEMDGPKILAWRDYFDTKAASP